jgi:EAL domain-containing protein (putative c-di-GMP-specific phosphodiesterase class I)/FixJ family two-component response regulator
MGAFPTIRRTIRRLPRSSANFAGRTPRWHEGCETPGTRGTAPQARARPGSIAELVHYSLPSRPPREINDDAYPTGTAAGSAPTRHGPGRQRTAAEAGRPAGGPGGPEDGVIELVTDGRTIDFKSLRFLVVDDDRDQRYLLVRTLSGMGTARIVEAPSGHDALAMLDRAGDAFDVVVTDLQMPGMDGMELVRRIGERKLQVAVILVSGLDDVLLTSAATMAQAYGVRVIGAIEKPATRAKFYSVLSHYHAEAPTAETEGDVVFAPTVQEVLGGISSGQVEPFFQAVVELGSGKVIGAEALTRWRHPARGILGPEIFLPPLARAGYLDELSWIMLSMSAMEAGLWSQANLAMTVSVNVSATSLADPSYADAVTQIVTGHGLDPSGMILELTETEAILNIAAALENLTRLRIRGFGLAIDDYGVGYSSMQALSRMPFTEIKIDRSFVAAAAGDPKYRLMVEHTIAVAHQLGLKTVAEGVETRAEQDLLASLGCDRIQGFFVSRPVEGSVFLRWLLERRARLGPESFNRKDEARRFGT